MSTALQPTPTTARTTNTPQTLAVDLLNPSAEAQARTHKLKKIVPAPNSFFMDVKCPGCFQITTVFSHASTVVQCGSCATVLCQPSGGKAKLTEGEFCRLARRRRIRVCRLVATSLDLTLTPPRLLVPQEELDGFLRLVGSLGSSMIHMYSLTHMAVCCVAAHARDGRRVGVSCAAYAIASDGAGCIVLTVLVLTVLTSGVLRRAALESPIAEAARCQWCHSTSLVIACAASSVLQV
ncbi:hypothetical protein VHUM_04134 [Vanrija humicola]|uniref:40S ribosomal protein S27 n=1 Tax=Vanrija humicola TaxID=5417 RepID=A0A7D8YZ50_VANHU|nr:hypothetical protein VHUM_04134 [Vanrija humicola]